MVYFVNDNFYVNHANQQYNGRKKGRGRTQMRTHKMGQQLNLKNKKMKQDNSMTIKTRKGQNKQKPTEGRCRQGNTK